VVSYRIYAACAMRAASIDSDEENQHTAHMLHKQSYAEINKYVLCNCRCYYRSVLLALALLRLEKSRAVCSKQLLHVHASCTPV
jgi:hypothetical protein